MKAAEKRETMNSINLMCMKEGNKCVNWNEYNLINKQPNTNHCNYLTMNKWMKEL